MKLSDVARSAAPTVAAAVAGSAASASGASSPWYASLRKPSFQPPPAAFPVVWTALYASVVGASAAAQDAMDDAAKARYRQALAVNLALNAAWPWAFFRFHRLGLSVAVAAALAASTAGLARRAAAARRPAGVALLPYVAWTGFATVLSEAVRRANPGR